MFIPRLKFEIGDKVESLEPLTNSNGTFTTGHQFTITGKSIRGFDLTDEDSNRAIEVAVQHIKLVSKGPK